MLQTFRLITHNKFASHKLIMLENDVVNCQTKKNYGTAK